MALQENDSNEELNPGEGPIYVGLLQSPNLPLSIGART